MRRIQLDGPHAIEGANNAYVFPDQRLVVDPGPPTEVSWNALVEGLEMAGLSVEDVEQVLVTHWHGDHSGQAPRVADRSGATVALHPDDAARVRDYTEARDRRLQTFARTLERWGTPEPVIRRLCDRKTVGEAMEPCEVTTVDDGDQIGELTAIHTPGHTLGHLAFDAPDGVLVGDVVLPEYTPNIGGTDIRLDNPLGRYLASLAKLRYGVADGGGTTAYPGHGRSVDLVERINDIVDHHEQRCRRIRSTLEEHGPATPWTVATDLFGDMSGIHARLGVGEAASHLMYLQGQGAVELVGEAPYRYTVCDTGTQYRLNLPDGATDQ